MNWTLSSLMTGVSGNTNAPPTSMPSSAIAEVAQALRAGISVKNDGSEQRHQ